VARVATTTIICLLVFAAFYLESTSANGITRPIPTSRSAISAIGWPFIFRTAWVNELPNGVLKYSNSAWAFEHLAIDLFAITSLSVLAYFSLAKVIIPNFPRLGLSDVFALIAACSIATCWLLIDYDLFMFNHFPVAGDSPITMTASQRPLGHSIMSGVLVGLAGFFVVTSMFARLQSKFG
jgi:hypothetical protein